MVVLNIFVRPKNGYCYPNKIRKVTVDSSQRLEDIVEKDKRSLLYSNGRELPLNSSFASNNVQDGDILESCSSPIMSSILSAVLQDLTRIEKIPEDQRTEERIRPLLGNVVMEPWPDRWSFEAIKSRKICLATMKKILQRDDRFANTRVPKISTLMELYNFMKIELTRDRSSRGHNSMAHIFKPTAKNRDGQPTICWELLQHKLSLAEQARRNSNNDSVDWIELFVRNESGRHASVLGTPSSAARRPRSTPVPRRKRNLPTPTTGTPNRGRQNQAKNIPCQTCSTMAECVCLDPSCAFFKNFSCVACFISNHPRHIRNHERVSLNDQRTKGVIKERTKPAYCPEYASGPFSILCTLLEASERTTNREFSLTESRLKKKAQGRCRSNLYDRQARGRNAFACIENLADKQLVRKELIPGQEEGKFSLLPAGEEMARLCLTFESCVNEVLPKSIPHSLTNGLAASNYSNANNPISLIIDTREDAAYASRLSEHCYDVGIPCDKRELPAGDYLFTMNGGQNSELVLPVVIERKSWSDLADSVNGRGKGHRRLDCVRVGGNGQCSSGRCQLCRMKASGCSKVMFIIEGARCLNRDEDKKCDNIKRCQYCKELAERHGPHLMHEELERVIYALQAKHGCLIHFTRGYNETIDSLLIINRILGGYSESMVSKAHPLTYDLFCSNARRSKNETVSFHDKKGEMGILDAGYFVQKIKEDKVWELFSSNQASSNGHRTKPVENLNAAFLETQAANGSKPNKAASKVVEIDISDEDDENFCHSQETIYVMDNQQGWNAISGRSNSKKAETKTDCIEIDSDSDDCIEVNEKQKAKRQKPNVVDDEILVLDSDEEVPEVSTTRMGMTKLRTPLFVITGMYEYDNDFYRDMNKIWQSLYRVHSSKSKQEFGRLVLGQLRSLQNEEPPFVKRESILFWTLEVQLRENFLLHLARQTNCYQTLEEFWLEGDCPTPRQSRIRQVARRQKTATPRSSLKTPPVYNQEVTTLNFGSDDDDDIIVAPSLKQRSTPVSGRKRKAAQQADQKPAPVNNSRVREGRSGSRRESDVQARVRAAWENKFDAAASVRSLDSGDEERNPNESSKNGWRCSSCTLMNERGASKCAACYAGKSWFCPACTYENKDNESKCKMCNKPNPSSALPVDCDQTRHRIPNLPPRPPVKKPYEKDDKLVSQKSSKSNVKCGACGGYGHNRGSATPANCTAYWNESEIKLRKDKKEKAETKAKEARISHEEFERRAATSDIQREARMAELQRLMAEQERDNEASRQMTQSELNRRKKAADRAEKRARRLG